jgi:hypothetical protein
MEFDQEEGLPEAIKLKVGDWQHYQKLDYEQIPFKCRGCHNYRHFQRNCPKNPNMEKESGEGWKQTRKGRSNSKTKGPRNEKTTPTQPMDPGNKSNTRAENTFRILARELVEKTIEENTHEESPTEEARENPTPEVRESHSSVEEEEKRKSIPIKDTRKNIEEGEVSSNSGYKGASDSLATPKKIGRGKKSKKEERDKETYKNVLKGSQPTFKQLINVRKTRKHSKASQDGQASRQGN